MASLFFLVATVPFAPAAYLLFQRITIGFSKSTLEDLATSLFSIHSTTTTTTVTTTSSSSNLKHEITDFKGPQLNNFTITSQLLAYILLAVVGHFATHYLIPKIKV